MSATTTGRSNEKSGLPDYKFPEVLLRSPRGLIALAGLDITNNAIHRLVWEEFSSGSKRSDRKPILFKNFPANHLYPKCGKNHTTYEDYSLEGILKISWLLKHCEELPALVAFFFDLDWNDPQWDERQTECVSKVEVIRSTLQNRGTEIVIVLLQSSPPLPMGEASNINSERAAALCTACELPRLNLFVLPFTQRPQGFISKIEEAFYKRAVAYYTNKIHTTKAHREMIANKQSLQSLFIRHNFKMAFFAEMKQDPVNALKLYRMAYIHLLENMYLSDDHIMEFKMIAGFINYKICRLCFESNEPLDAITQFRKHIDRFSAHDGMKQLAYEHFEWLSRQFSAFADLFSESVRKGLKGLQTQNPGLYYHQAALYAIQRKEMASQLTVEPNATQVLVSMPQPSYYGQRPWRKGLSDDKPSNMELRQKCIWTMQSQEKSVEHSWQIIPLLTQAISHLKSYSCERLITFLKVLTADEYYQVRDYEKSFVLLNGVAEVYRTEQWWRNLTTILLRFLRYCYLLGFIQEYITVGLELISRYIPIEKEEKKRIQNNITEIFSNQTPFPEPGLSTDDIQHANVQWAHFWQKCPLSTFTIQLSSLASCVECKTVFTKSRFKADELVRVKVYFRSSAPLSINLRKLKLLFMKEEYNSLCVHEDGFSLEPGVIKTFFFSFPSFPTSVGGTLEVHAVEATLECDRQTHLCPSLIWSNGASESFTSQPSDLAWQKVELRNSTMIQPRPSFISITLEHSNPALMGEYYAVTVGVVNKERTPITDLNIEVSLPESLSETEPQVEILESVPGDSAPMPSSVSQAHQLKMTHPQLDTEGSNTYKKTLCLCSHAIGTRKISIVVTYKVACRIDDEWDLVTCLCEEHHSELLQIVKPFDMVYKLMTTKFRPMDTIAYNSPFILMTELSSTSPWDLLIVDSKFEPSDSVQYVGENSSQVQDLEMDPKDKATECYCLLAQSNQMHVSLGTYTISWKRSANPASKNLVSVVSFPPITAKFQTYTLSADIPSYGQMLEVLPVTYTVRNKSNRIQEFEVKVGASDAFMYSGNRISKFRILPASKHTFAINLLPVVTGLVSLPVIDLSCQRESEKGTDPLLSNCLPTSILIKPSPITVSMETR